MDKAAALRNKTILVISPQPWDHLYISKHHYARELGRRGNRVYFLDPPDEKLDARVRVEPTGEEGVSRVRYRPWFPFRVRFHARALYDFLLRYQIARILHAIGRPLDVVWCFDFNLFTDLRRFGAETRIYHPVDPVSAPHQIHPAGSATLTLVSDPQFKTPFEAHGYQAHFLNHGVAPFFVAAADQKEEKVGEVQAGYAGNLLRPELHRTALRQIIDSHPQVVFHFWGEHDAARSHHAVPEDAAPFVDWLAAQRNVRLHGPIPPDVLAAELARMDVLLLVYRQEHPGMLGFNPHKVLEYLSTGRTVVSNTLAAYQGTSDLLLTPPDDDPNCLHEVFETVVQNLTYYNGSALQARRRELALDHTYERQVQRVEQLLLSASLP